MCSPFLYKIDLEVERPNLGMLKVDVAYGSNFYAIIDSQENFADMDQFSAADSIRWSQVLRQRLNAAHSFVHPEKQDINGLSHIMWIGTPKTSGGTARNAVFYGDKAIDRSPCRIGTSARMAQWYGKGKLKAGDTFVHESIIGSIFKGRVEDTLMVGDLPAIVSSIAGWARMTELNTIFVDDCDPFKRGFLVS